MRARSRRVDDARDCSFNDEEYGRSRTSDSDDVSRCFRHRINSEPLSSRPPVPSG